MGASDVNTIIGADAGGAVVVLSTAPAAEAGEMARALVGRHLVACVNITPVTSIYRWEGAICEEGECLMVIKTTQAKLSEVVQAVAEIHPYKVPEVIALPVIGGAGPYLAWVTQETAP
ncbi:MAG: divalent-cation tolerance protein CutA [Methanomicrobiales archaeon]|jgi:periplasmic divalent cation tolerance protein|nr:divalent-cation tolerance protein CutA [Methanomicrobiales archaeon]